MGDEEEATPQAVQAVSAGMFTTATLTVDSTGWGLGATGIDSTWRPAGWCAPQYEEARQFARQVARLNPEQAHRWDGAFGIVGLGGRQASLADICPPPDAPGRGLNRPWYAHMQAGLRAAYIEADARCLDAEKHRHREEAVRMHKRRGKLARIAATNPHNFRLVDQSKAHGALYHVYGDQHSFGGAKNKLAFLVVECPSTQKTHVLFVPKDMTDAHEARAWTFGKTKESFNPGRET